MGSRSIRGLQVSQGEPGLLNVVLHRCVICAVIAIRSSQGAAHLLMMNAGVPRASSSEAEDVWTRSLCVHAIVGLSVALDGVSPIRAQGEALFILIFDKPVKKKSDQ